LRNIALARCLRMKADLTFSLSADFKGCALSGFAATAKSAKMRKTAGREWPRSLPQM
jgi:hypothetical protein